MDAFYLGYLLLFGVSALVCTAGAYRAREIPDPSVRRSLASLLLTCGGWAGAYVGAILASTEGGARAFHLLGLVFGAVAVGAWVWFCSAYAGRDLHRDPGARQVGFWVLALVVATKLTNPWHGLYFTTAPAEAPFPHLALDYHSLYWGSAGLAYALAAVGYFILYDLFRNVGSRGGALGPLAGLMALPIVLNAAGYASPLFLNVSHEPLGVAVFAIGVFFLYGEEFEAVRFAGGQEEPAFVLGGQGTVREYNQSAEELLRERANGEAPLGTPIGELLPEVWEALKENDPTIRIGEGPSACYYQLEKPPSGPFFDSGGGGPSHFLVLTDVTDHKVREEALKEESAALRRMSRVTSDPEAPFEEKISRLLQVGREYLGLPHGFLAEIDGDTQRIVAASGPGRPVEPGETCRVSEAYCKETIQADRPVVTRGAADSGTAESRAAESRAAESRRASPEQEGGPPETSRPFASHVGAKVMVDGQLYGTFCFGGPEPRSFSERETAFVALLARWTSYEIERREAERQLERQNERLERFSGVLTHDLRNPLNVAQGRLTLALEEIESLEERKSASGPDNSAGLGMLPDHLRSAGRALDRMERLVEDTLALTWSEQGFEAEEMEAVSLRTVAEGCWQQVDTGNATLQVEDDLRLRAHEGRLQQLLENLFRNAVEHGGEAVRVTVGPLPEGASPSEGEPKGFFVEDDGPGIPEGRRDKIFERGYSSEEEGTGLGLSIAQAIAEAHGWTVSVTEGREGGARFEFRGAKPQDG